jgi:hypothetical protein
MSPAIIYKPKSQLMACNRELILLTHYIMGVFVLQVHCSVSDSEKEAREKCRCAEDMSNVDEAFANRKRRRLAHAVKFMQ